MHRDQDVGKQVPSVKTQKFENLVFPAPDARNLANPHSCILLIKTVLNVMVISHKWPFISGFRTEMPYRFLSPPLVLHMAWAT